jgi:MFS family permease
MAVSLGRLTMGRQWRLDIGAVLVYFALGAMFSAAPRYVSEELDGSKALAGFSVSIFFVAAVLARPVVGRLVDRIGRRPFLVAPPFVLAVLMLCLLGAKWVPVVLVVRFLQGLAGSAFYVAAVTTSTDLAPPDRRASAVARLSIAIYLGFALGPAFGEVLLDRGIAWAWPALAALLVAGGLFTATMPESRPEPAADAPAPGKMPLIYRGAVLPGLVLLALGVGYTSITAHSALFARSIGLTSSGALYATFAVSVLLVRLGSGRLADTIGPLRVLYPGIASLASGLFVLSLIPEPVAAVIGVALVGAGWALVFPAMIAWMAATVPDAQRGAAMGSLVAFMDIGQGAGGYLVGAVADGPGFGWAYALPATLALLSVIPMTIAVRRAPDAPISVGQVVEANEAAEL